MKVWAVYFKLRLPTYMFEIQFMPAQNWQEAFGTGLFLHETFPHSW